MARKPFVDCCGFCRLLLPTAPAGGAAFIARTTTFGAIFICECVKCGAFCAFIYWIDATSTTVCTFDLASSCSTASGTGGTTIAAGATLIQVAIECIESLLRFAQVLLLLFSGDLSLTIARGAGSGSSADCTGSGGDPSIGIFPSAFTYFAHAAALTECAVLQFAACTFCPAAAQQGHDHQDRNNFDCLFHYDCLLSMEKKYWIFPLIDYPIHSYAQLPAGQYSPS